MQTYLSISESKLNENASLIVDHAKSPIIAVVKCNGYGIGIENAVNAWIKAGVRFFAVAEPIEAFMIAEMGLDNIDILLLSPCADEKTIIKLADMNVIFTVSNKQSAELLTKCANGRKIRAHVKVDTGMGRFGESYRNIEKIKSIYSVKEIDFCGIFSHFALSFEQKYENTKIQLERFLNVVKKLENSGINVGMRHIANSCAALLYDETKLDAVRIGSALVGRTMKQTPIRLNKIGVLKAQVVDVKTLEKGDTSGYAMIYKSKKNQQTAVVELGFRYGFGMTRKSDSFRFVDVLRDIFHALKGFGKSEAVVDENNRSHSVVGRIGNQYTLVENNDNSLKIGDYVSCNVNVLMIDSAVNRVLE